MKTSRIVAACMVLMFSAGDVFAGDMAKAPPVVQGAVLMQTMGFNKNLRGDVALYVLGDSVMAAEFKKLIGMSIGAATLKTVKAGDVLPAESPQIIYIGDKGKVAEVLAYTSANGVMSIAGDPGIIAEGASLGVGVVGRKPQVLLGIAGSKAEKIHWNPAILKIAVKM